MQKRQYDIDTLRVCAIGLLLVYHTAVVFQPWGRYIGFITSDLPWQEIWQPMSAINIWRIPVLFFISGMALFFSQQNRGWKELLIEKSKRLIIPFLTGMAIAVPGYIYLLQFYNGWPLTYHTHASHLWFLGVVFLCFLLSFPLFLLLNKHRNHAVVLLLMRYISSPLILPVVVMSFVLESVLVKPMLFELYANTSHGFFLGLLGMIWGYLFAMAGDGFRAMLSGYRWILLPAAVLIYSCRIWLDYRWPITIMKPVESCLWVFTLFAFSFRYLNVPNRFVQYLSKAIYPVYIVHLFFLGAACLLVLPMDISNPLKYLLLLTLSAAGSLGFYEFAVKRINVLRFLFGLRGR
jgi:glucans biosynthesis protein C